MDADLPEDTKLVDGVIVIECDHIPTEDDLARLRELAGRCWSDRKIAILGPGLRIGFTTERLDRFEEKLDRILSDMVRKPYYGGGPG